MIFLDKMVLVFVKPNQMFKGILKIFNDEQILIENEDKKMLILNPKENVIWISNLLSAQEKIEIKKEIQKEISENGFDNESIWSLKNKLTEVEKDIIKQKLNSHELSGESNNTYGRPGFFKKQNIKKYTKEKIRTDTKSNKQ